MSCFDSMLLRTCEGRSHSFISLLVYTRATETPKVQATFLNKLGEGLCCLSFQASSGFPHYISLLASPMHLGLMSLESDRTQG